MSSSVALCDWMRKNAHGFSGQLFFDELLSRHTYYRIGGAAAVLAIPQSSADLDWLARARGEAPAPHFILGAGSNILASDLGFDGLIIKCGKINLSIDRDPTQPFCLVTGASVSISSLLRKATQMGWGGLEFLTGIPGSVGGAVSMNAGTHLGESSACLREVRVFDLDAGFGKREWTYKSTDLQYEYRKNQFLPISAVIVSATWTISDQESAEIKKLIDETLIRRKATQPLDYPSCGSVFKNPEISGQQAWQVIDRLGLRGHRIGDAQIAQKHSNWILNLGKATSKEVRSLIDLVKSRAHVELGIELEPEVQFIGTFEQNL